LRIDALTRNNFVCGSCKEEKEQHYFSSNATNTQFGFSYICKPCLKNRGRFSKAKTQRGLSKQELL